ncbi:cadherin-86C-like [Amphibalanus amphitrite]|uniref:cadherin-86C-like n=1 Tax=Amphibalanus amphitrite TaxID=1232801 RepID=UPI001C91FB6C|nr:cadherin-86C-like [Amphibalanus amphitrite]
MKWNGYRDTTIDTRNIMELRMNLLVRDVQDTPPFFASAPALLRVSNSAKPGDVIGTFRALDGDRQNPREIRYRLVPNGLGYDSYFSMDPVSGNLSVTSSLTGLLTSRLEPMTVTVSAEEVTTSLSERGESAQRDVVVIREDAAHQAPQFRPGLYETQLFENPAIGTLLNFDPPLETTGQRGSFTLTIVGDLASRCFEVDPPIQTREGQFYIRVKNKDLLDFEELPNPVLVFSVRADEVDPERRSGRLLTSLANISVTILDQNDNPPVFEKTLYPATFMENVVRGTTVLRVSATDADQSDAGRVTYTRLTGDNAADLNLDPSTGDITIKFNNHEFDFERQEDYQLQVYAVDSGRPQLTGSASIILSVQDFNDHFPVFTKTLYNGKLNPDGNGFEEPLIVHVIRSALC